MLTETYRQPTHDTKLAFTSTLARSEITRHTEPNGEQSPGYYTAHSFPDLISLSSSHIRVTKQLLATFRR